MANEEKWKKGSMTVEASVITPCIVIVTAALCILTFFVHNRVYYQSAACECGILANSRMEKNADIDSVVWTRANERMDDQAMPGTRPEVSIQTGSGRSRIAFFGQRFSMFSEELFNYRAEQTVELVSPIASLRRKRMMTQLWKEEAS